LALVSAEGFRRDRESAEILLQRHGIVAVAVRWAALDSEHYLQHVGAGAGKDSTRGRSLAR
jgi:hypothetical protein